MKKKSSSRIIALLLLGAALAFLVIRLMPFIDEAGSPGSQAENLRLARGFIAAHDKAIHSDSRFEQIILAAFTGRGGCLQVMGNVASEADRRDLRRTVMAKKPPVEVFYTVYVGLQPTASPTR